VLPELALVRESFEGVPVTRLRTVPEAATSLRATYRNERVRAAFERELQGEGAAASTSCTRTTRSASRSTCSTRRGAPAPR
jgi:hypothetical protein